jgi:dGTP triphosphohydrolase
MENLQLEPIRQDVQEILYNFQEIKPVLSEEEYTQCGDTIKVLKFKVKKLEEKRKELTAPILAAKKNIDDNFKTITEPLEEVISKIESEMKVFWRADQERKNAEQKRLEAEAIEKAKELGQSEVQVEIVNEKKSATGEISKTIYTEKWTFEIIDESEVPNIYCSPDKKKIDEAIKAGAREIKGLRIFDDGKITSR